MFSDSLVEPTTGDVGWWKLGTISDVVPALQLLLNNPSDAFDGILSELAKTDDLLALIPQVILIVILLGISLFVLSMLYAALSFGFFFPDSPI